MTEKIQEVPSGLRGARKTRVGIVVSDKMDKTRVVKDYWLTNHPRYRKVIRRATNYYAHDAQNESKVGDRVEIVETRPYSKSKRWRVSRVVTKAGA